MNASAAIADTGRLKSRESPEAFYLRAKINRRALDLASAGATRLPALWTAGMRAGSPFSPSTYSFKYASVPRGSARPSRHATAGDPLLLRLQWVRATNRHEQSGLDEEVEP